MQEEQPPVCGRCGQENPGNYCSGCGARQRGPQSPSGSTQFPWKPVLAVLAAALVLTAVALILRQLVGEPPDPYQDGLRTPEQVLGDIKDIKPGAPGPADGRSNESTITVMDPETGEPHIIGRQGREITTHEVCAEGDYTPTAWDASQRAAECYNRGQEDAFKLLFEYSTGKIHTGYFLAEDLEAALTRSTLPSATVRLPVAFVEKGAAHLIHYDEYDYCPQLGINGEKGTMRLWTPPQTYSDANCITVTDAGPTDGAGNVSMTPVERATATAEAEDRALPLIIGQTGGECDSGYTRVAFSRALRDRLHPNDSVGWFADILKFGADRNLERTMMCSQDTGELPVEYTLQIRTEAELKHWLDHDLYTPITAPKDSTPIPEPTPTPRPTPGPSPTPTPSPTPVKQCKVFEEILGYRVHWYEMEWRPCNLLLPDEYCYSGQEATIYDGRSGIARPGVLDGYIKCKSESDTIKPPISQGNNRVCPSNREHEHTLPNGTKEIRISTPTPCPAPSTIPATSRPAESRVVKPSRGPEPNR